MTAVLSTVLLFLAADWDAEVTVAEVDPNPCDVCGTDAVTQARVYHDPRPDSTVFGMRECCVSCTRSVVADAHEAHDERSRRPIRVELSPTAA